MKIVLKLLFFIILLNISISAEQYQCKIDTVYNKTTKQYHSLAKAKWLSANININQNIAHVKLPELSKTTFTLPYKGFGNIKGKIKAEIYEEQGMQLEIIDISNSWSTGAKLYMRDRMFMIGYCKH